MASLASFENKNGRHRYFYSALQGRSLKPWGREWLNLTTHSKLLQSSNKRVTGAECFTTHLTRFRFRKVFSSCFSEKFNRAYQLIRFPSVHNHHLKYSPNLLKTTFWREKRNKEKWSWVFPFFWTEGTLYLKTKGWEVEILLMPRPPILPNFDIWRFQAGIREILLSTQKKRQMRYLSHEIAHETLRSISHEILQRI